ncbi:MAG: helix-hairpin-helix domain-containing protein [Desulfocapsa sp.]|nr:helix-hairpin-helix domain-containing protein [Desulfocapsa sp.]
MKNPDRETVSRLEDLPNIGPSMADTLRLLDIQHPQQLTGKNAYQMYKALCMLTNKEHDPCVIDVFLAAVAFMEGGDPVPWYHFTEERKRHYPLVKQ